MLLIESEAKAKWDRLPQNEKDNLIKDYGILAKPFWVYFATHCEMTEEGKKL